MVIGPYQWKMNVECWQSSWLNILDWDNRVDANLKVLWAFILPASLDQIWSACPVPLISTRDGHTHTKKETDSYSLLCAPNKPNFQWQELTVSQDGSNIWIDGKRWEALWQQCSRWKLRDIVLLWYVHLYLFLDLTRPCPDKTPLGDCPWIHWGNGCPVGFPLYPDSSLCLSQRRYFQWWEQNLVWTISCWVQWVAYSSVKVA